MDPTKKYCSLCKNPIESDDAFCTACGTAVPAAPAAAEPVVESTLLSAPPVTVAEPSSGVYYTPNTPPSPPPLTEKLPPAGATPDAAATNSPSTPSSFSSMPPQSGATGVQAPAPQPITPSQPMQQPVGYGAPAQPTSGHGTPPPVPPTTAPPVTTPGGSVQPYKPSPPPKKKNPALIIIFCVVLPLLLIGGIALFMLYGPPATTRKDKKIGEEYQLLLTSICKLDSISDIADQRDRLDTFMYDHPGRVDTDLDKLVTACENYEFGNMDNKENYLSMIKKLERLEKSSVTEVADCAKTLLPDVKEAYDAFLEEGGGETAVSDASTPMASDPFASPTPFDKLDEQVYIKDDLYYFEFQNVSGKTIEYLECWIFCYDEMGNPIEGVAIDFGLDNVEWEVDEAYLVDGSFYKPEDVGVFKFYRCKGTSFAIPFINYVQFSDGTSWGMTNFDYDMNVVLSEMREIKTYADAYAKTLVQA